MEHRSRERWRKGFMRKCRERFDGTLWHGTVPEAALDIFDHRRVLLGVGNRFWMSSDKFWAWRYGRRKGLISVHLVRFEVASIAELEYTQAGVWTMFVKDGVDGLYYPLRGVVPVEVVDHRGKVLRTNQQEGGLDV